MLSPASSILIPLVSISMFGIEVHVGDERSLIIDESSDELKLKKRLLLRCIHHFKSDLINDMDHMLISGTEPSSVILSQRK